MARPVNHKHGHAILTSTFFLPLRTVPPLSADWPGLALWILHLGNKTRDIPPG